MIFSKFFKKQKFKKNVRMIPCHEMHAAFGDTVESCFLWNWDRNHENYYAIREVFKTFPNEIKHKLTFSPKDGEFCERAQFGRSVLRSDLPPVLYYDTMRAIYCCYKRCKKVHRTQAVTQATYTNMLHEGMTNGAKNAGSRHIYRIA